MSYVLTFVSSTIAGPVTESHIIKAANILKPENINQSCQPLWLSKDKAVDLGVDARPDSKLMKVLRDMLMPSAIDVFISPVEGRRKKLLLADMDSTIVQGETLDELASFAGLKDKIAAITAKAMEGKLDFHSALRERVAMLRKMPTTTLEQTLGSMNISPGAKTLVHTMKKFGAKCVLVSGGFTYFTEAIARDVGFHAHHGNVLEIENETMTGRVVPPILDKQAKVNFLREYAGSMRIKPQNCVAIGDGANDLPMLEIAGLAVGYRPKGVVMQSIDNVILHGDLSAALYAQGYYAQDIERQ